MHVGGNEGRNMVGSQFEANAVSEGIPPGCDLSTGDLKRQPPLGLSGLIDQPVLLFLQGNANRQFFAGGGDVASALAQNESRYWQPSSMARPAC